VRKRSDPVTNGGLVDLTAVNATGIARQSGPDTQTESEADQLEQDRARADLVNLNLQNRSLFDDLEARKKFATRIFWLTVGWLIAVLVIVVWSGAGWLRLDTKIVLGLIGSGSVNVLTLFGSVTGYLFPKRK
jgi:hypothetical protein